MNFFLEPLFWGILSIFVLLLLIVQESFRQYQKKIGIKAFLAIIFVICSLMLIQPYNMQPRFALSGWQTPIATIFLFLSIFLLFSSSYQIIDLFRGKDQFSTDGIYSWMRNPLHLGIILLILGSSILFRSSYGLLLLILWIPGLYLHILLQEQNFQEKSGLPYLHYQTKVKYRFIPILNREDPAEKHPFPFKNLVFKGGGVKGIAYKGVLQVLDEYHILDQIERVAGTSAGAITAMILSFRLDLRETIELIDSLVFTEIPEKISTDEAPGDWAPDFMKKEFFEISGNIECMRRLTKNYGWYSSGLFYNWLKNTIARYCEGNGMATFEEFHERGFRDLNVVATNLSKYSGEVFSYSHTPHTAVADAVRMSMSIPLYFEAMRYDGIQFGSGDIYVDGGMFYNYPTYIFDAPEFSKNNSWYSNGINWETLGFYLYPLEESLSREKSVNNIIEYIERLLDNIAQASEITAMQAITDDSRRTVKISDCNVAPTDFFIDSEHIKYHELMKSGREATRSFLDHFLTPKNFRY